MEKKINKPVYNVLLLHEVFVVEIRSWWVVNWFLKANKNAWSGKKPIEINLQKWWANRASKLLKVYLFYLVPAIWDTLDCITKVLCLTLLIYSQGTEAQNNGLCFSTATWDGVRSSCMFIFSILFRTKRKETWRYSLFS